MVSKHNGIKEEFKPKLDDEPGPLTYSLSRLFSLYVTTGRIGGNGSIRDYVITGSIGGSGNIRLLQNSVEYGFVCIGGIWSISC